MINTKQNNDNNKKQTQWKTTYNHDIKPNKKNIRYNIAKHKTQHKTPSDKQRTRNKRKGLVYFLKDTCPVKRARNRLLARRPVDSSTRAKENKQQTKKTNYNHQTKNV